MRKRLLLYTFVALLVVAVAGVLWAVSSVGVTPAQRVADAEPPPPPVVNAQVEERQLSDIVVIRGVVVTVDEYAIGAPEIGESLPVVVRLPVAVGDKVVPGDVVMNVSDRPVIVVPMPVPLHRSLTPGVEGEDVARFQRSLRYLGYGVEVSGIFDPETQVATRALFEDRGFEILETGDEMAAALRAAEAGVRSAESALRAARATEDWRTVRDAKEALQAAEEARDRAAARVGVLVPLGEVVGIGSLPMVVSSVDAPVGSVVEGSVLSLTSSDLAIDATVDLTLVPLLSPGVAAAAGDSVSPLEVVSNDRRDDTGRPIVRFRATDPLPPEMLGRDLRIEAEIEATDGPVLAVPVTAIRSGDSGEFLRVVVSDGTVREVAVRTGTSIGGWVEIVESAEELAPGTVVRVG